MITAGRSGAARRRGKGRRGGPLLPMVLAAVLLSAAEARGDLLGDVADLQATWTAAGATVRRAAPLFLTQDERRLVRVDSPAGSVKRCVTVVALAERQIGFHLAPGPSPAAGLPAGEADGGKVQSQSGVAVLRDCGDGRLAQGRVEVGMDARRAAVDVLVVAHDAPLVPLVMVLPERAVGPVAPRGELGAPLLLAPVTDREARARQAARNDGAKLIARVVARASDRGGGAAVLKLTKGCHRLNVLADQAGASDPVDIDADVRLEGAPAPLRRDRSHAPDGRLDFCLGETAKVEVRFLGAGGPTQVVVLDAYWPVSRTIPTHWGPAAAAGLSWALFRRRAPQPTDPPIFQAVGAPGVTALPLALEPGACYLAAFAAVRDGAGAGRLTVTVGGQSQHDDANEEPRAGAVSFCAPAGVATGRAVVDLRGTKGLWVLALWRVGGPRR